MKNKWLILLSPLAPAILIAILFFVRNDTVFEPPYLLPVLNTIFISILPLIIALMSARAFTITGKPSILLLGAAMMSLGTAGMISGWLITASKGPDATITVYNSGMLLSAFFHFAAGLVSIDFYKEKTGKGRSILLAAAYAAPSLLLISISLAAARDLTPSFIIQGVGPTVIGRTVLNTGIILLAATCCIALRHYFTSGLPVFLWYGTGLGFFVVGLTGVFLQHAVGSLIGWAGRFSQYAGAVCLLAGVTCFASPVRGKGLSVSGAIDHFFKDAEANYKALVQTVRDGIVSLDDRGRVLLWNKGAEDLFGYGSEEAESKVLADLIQPECSDPAWLSNLSCTGIGTSLEGIAGSKPLSIEAMVQNKEGLRFPVECSISMRETPDGTIMTCIIRDVTDRKKEEEARNRSESRFKLLSKTAGRLLETDDPLKIVYELADEVMKELECQVFFNFVLDADTGKLRLNAYAGIPEEESRKIAFMDVGVAVCGCVAQNGVPVFAENIRSAPDPATDRVESYGIDAYACHPLIAGGRVIGTLSFGTRTRSRFSSGDLDVMKTVTDQVAVAIERMNLLEILRGSEERQRLALDAAQMGTYHWNAATDRIVWSDMYRKIYGFPPDTPASYDNWLASLLPEDRNPADQAVRRAMENRTDYDAEFRILRPDGSVRWLSGKGRFYYGKDGSPLHMEGVVFDITERKQARDALIKTQYLLTEGQRIAHVGSFEYIAETGHTVWSDEEYRIYGIEPAVPSPVYEDILATFIHPDDVRLVDRTLTAAMQSGSVYELEHRVVRPDGSMRWVYNLAHPYVDDSGKLVRYIGTTLDITGRKQREAEIQNLNADLERRIAERTAELRISEEKYRLLVETTSDCIWEMDADGRFTYLSPTFLNITGYHPEEFLGKTPVDLAPEDDRPRIGELVFGPLSARQPFSSMEYPVWHREGKRVIVEISAVPIFGSDGSFAGFRGITRDITRRKEMEESLRDSEERFHAIFDNTLEGVLLVSPEGSIYAANAAACDILGWSEDALCRNGWGVFADLTDPRMQAALEERRRTGRFRGELDCKRKDGSTLPVELSSTLFILQNGEHRACIVFRNIAKRKRLERELQRRERDLRAILNHIPSLVGYWDKDLRSRFGNHAYCDWFGIDSSRLPGMHYRDVLGEEASRLNMPYIEAALAGQPQIFERSVLSRDGSTTIYCLAHYIPDFSNGEVQGFYVLVSDITPVKLAEEQRKQLVKAESLNRMAGAIAHHFNNQLYVVIGNLELLMDRTPLGSDSNVMLIDAMAASHKAADISKMMLTYLGQSPGKPEIQDLSETCHKGLLMVQPFIPKNISLETKIPFPGPNVNANAKQLQQIISNLITNAWESITTPQGTVSLQIKSVSAADIRVLNRFPVGWHPEEGGYACLEVIDTGCGIPKEDIDKIFDPFFTTKFTGRGLGLSVILGILGKHGGAITVENRMDGGCAFRVFLPLVSRAAAAVAAEKTKQEGGHSELPQSFLQKPYMLRELQDAVEKILS